MRAGSDKDVETVRAFFQNLLARGLARPPAAGGQRPGTRDYQGSRRTLSPFNAPALPTHHLAAKVSTDLSPDFKASVSARWRCRGRSRGSWC
jgi:hypothetical protein